MTNPNTQPHERRSKVLPRSRVREGERAVPVFIPHLGESAPTEVSPSRPTHPSHQPRVHVVRDGNTIQAIEITCSCGQEMRLICEY